MRWCVAEARGKGTRAWNQIARKEKRSEHRVSSVPRPSFSSIFVARARAQLEHTVLVARIPARLPFYVESSVPEYLPMLIYLSVTRRDPLPTDSPSSRSGCVLLRTRLETTQAFFYLHLLVRTRGRNATPCRMLGAR